MPDTIPLVVVSLIVPAVASIVVVVVVVVLVVIVVVPPSLGRGLSILASARFLVVELLVTSVGGSRVVVIVSSRERGINQVDQEL